MKKFYEMSLKFWGIGRLAFILFLVPVIGFSQEDGGDEEIPEQTDYNVDMFPKTAEAAALSKFVDIPGGNYTGIAEFSIPIYTINVDGISIPIQLRYSTSGVKVGDLATRTGLGWVLDTGPSLSQQVMGTRDYTLIKPVLQDEVLNGEIIISGTEDPNDPNNLFNILMHATDFTNEFLVGPSTPPVDMKPDIFTYSLLNTSGKYILDASGTHGIPLPYNQLKIEPQGLEYVRIKDEQGVFYQFSNVEELGGSIKVYNNCAGMQMLTPDLVYNDPDYKIAFITTPKNKTIEYKYNKATNSKYVNSLVENQLIDWSNSAANQTGTPETEICMNYTDSNEKILTQIEFEGGNIFFYYSADGVREDIPGEVYLTQIVVENLEEREIANYTFEYAYFESADLPNVDYQWITEYLDGINKRLKLTKVIDNLTGNFYELEYFESYNNKVLPNRISYNQDYWGVYNGKTNTKTGIPKTKYDMLRWNRTKLFTDGANKQPDINYGVLGNLKEIIYPTGGKTVIEYEADDFVRGQGVPPIYDYVWDDAYVSISQMEEIFEIPEGAFDKIIDFTNNNTTGLNQLGYCSFELKKKLEDGSFTTVYEGDNFEGTFERDNDQELPGIYKLILIPGDENSSTNNNDNSTCNATYYWRKEVIADNSPVRKSGTIRVKSIKAIDADGDQLIRNFEYKDPETGLSSGKNLGTEIMSSISIKEVPLGSSGSSYEKLYLSNNPGWQTATVRGKPVGYDYVQEFFVSSKNEPEKTYRKEYRYKNDADDAYTNYYIRQKDNITWPVDGLDRGLLLEEKLFDHQNNLIRHDSISYSYDTYFNQNSTSHHEGMQSLGSGLEVHLKETMMMGWSSVFVFDVKSFPLKNFWITDTLTVTKEFMPDGRVMKTERSKKYDIITYKHTYLKEQHVTNSQNEVVKTSFQYPQDLKEDYEQADLMNAKVMRNELSDPVIIKNYVDETVVSEKRTLYDHFNKEGMDIFTGSILPKHIYAKKGEMDDEAASEDLKITYNNYDSHGNLRQYTLEKGLKVSIIWGYGGQYPIAKVEGMQWSEIATLAASLESNNNLTVSSFDALRTFVDFSNSHAMLTCYLYEPMVGVTTIIQPNGQMEKYEYDEAGRLEYVKDHDNKIIRKIEYKYKNQQP